MIRPMDKGGGLVMSKTFYREEMGRLLKDKETYLPLRSDPVFEFKEELHYLIERGKEVQKGSFILRPFSVSDTDHLFFT